MSQETSPKGRVTILTVDDESMNNDLVRRAVRSQPRYSLIEVSSGEEGLEILEQQGIDIMLVDQSMPSMTGVEFLERAKKLAPEAVGILVTGYPELDDVTDALNRGLVTHIIAKPWRNADFLSDISRALAVRDMHLAVDKMKSKTKSKTKT